MEIHITDIIKPGEPFSFKSEFFTEPDFKPRFDQQMRLIRRFISQRDDQEGIKTYLNAFLKESFTLIKDEDLQLYMHIENYRTLIHYGSVFNSVQTFKNIINSIEKSNVKRKLLLKYPLVTYLVYGDALLKYYNIENDKNEGWFKENTFELMERAKYYLLKVYTQKIEGKNKLAEDDFNYCLVLLSGSFLNLSRWFEPLYYLKQLTNRERGDPNYDYLIALTLDALADKSCLDYNGQLLLKVFDSATVTVNNKESDPRQVEGATKIRDRAQTHLDRAKLSIEKLRQHKTKIENHEIRRNAYFKYCIDHQFFLNEHSFFCTCGRSVGDTLEIKTLHKHTRLTWVKKFNAIVNVLIADYEVARQNIFQHEHPKVFRSTFKKENKSDVQLARLGDARLKNAFKICYSILDQICYGIFEALEIDIKAHLEKTTEQGRNVPKTYFLSMWDQYKFTEQDFKNNLYLISLYSIAKDLDRNKFAALQSFKVYRNAMEHGMLFVKEELDSKSFGSIGDYKVIPRKELLEKTKLLMMQ